MINKYGKTIHLPKSTGTKGETLIEEILKEVGVNYKMQYAFNETGLRAKKYDAAVFDQAGDLKFLIEYDGREHYDPDWYEAMGTRPERCKMHVIRRNIIDARKMKIAVMHSVPVLRVNQKHEKELRDILLAWIWVFVDKNNDPTSEISAVKMLDKYGWDFKYVAPSDPSKKEAEFLNSRKTIKIKEEK